MSRDLSGYGGYGAGRFFFGVIAAEVVAVALLAVAAGAISPGLASAAGAETVPPPHGAAAFEAEPGAWLALADASEVPDDASAVILYRRSAFTFDAEGRLVHRRHTVYQIRDQSAAETPSFSTVYSSWAPWHQERPEIRARVIAPDGSVRELEPTALVEGPTADTSPDLFDDRLVLEGPLPGLRRGVIVELETVVRDREPYFAAGSTSLPNVWAAGDLTSGYQQVIEAAQTQVTVETAVAALDPRLWTLVVAEERRRTTASGVDAVVRARRNS